MSEIRSWDRSILVPNGVLYEKEEPGDILVRVVQWPEGAPAQEDVPQAGEEFVWGKEAKEPVTIYSGIPFKQGDRWALVVLSKSGGHHIAFIEYLYETPPTPPQTYTEDEVRRALNLFKECETYNGHTFVEKVLDQFFAFLKSERKGS